LQSKAWQAETPTKENLIIPITFTPDDFFQLLKTNKMHVNKTWHDQYKERLSFGQRLADKVARGMGSWTFIILQSIFVVVWMMLNVIAFMYHWDVYPFILLNLLFSTQAAYAAPIIMMAQNRQNERDRVQAEKDYQTNTDAKLEIEELQRRLNSIEIDKLDKIIRLLEEIKSDKQSLQP
jgi:uncharacterized membrane protein